MYIVTHYEFRNTVLDGWCQEVEGHCMYKVVKKLRMLKKPIRKIMWQKGNLHEHVLKLRMELDAAQLALDLNPFSVDIRGDESHLLQAYNDALLDEERFLKQKAKVEWLRVGDNNSRYSNNVVKSKINKSRIQVVMDVDGNMIDGNEVPNMFVNHYATFLGTATVSTPVHDPDSLFTRKVSNEKDLAMISMVSDEEVKAEIFDIGDNKSPGPDGYSSVYLKSHGILLV
ncbi:uncharacterized protein [Rutidosis leptorrhynchoides]|uniref:uncharacterized protein n=1 Tax=Rutidosis leptorrhynchoides TaxID=125765 RepID=UPI003A991C15